MENIDSIIRDIADVVAWNGVNEDSIPDIIDILNDETITDKTTAIADILEVGRYNIEQIRKVLSTYSIQ